MITGSSPPISDDIRNEQFKQMNYNDIKWDTWITDLKPDLDYLYKSLHNKTRYDIRKGEKK